MTFEELIEQLALEGEAKEQAIIELCELGEKDPRIVETLATFEHPNPAIHGEITSVLISIGPEVPCVIPRFVELLRNSAKDRYFRTQAGVALRSIGAEAVPVFVQLCRDPDSHTRFTAARELAELVDHWDQAAVQALVGLLKDEEAHVRDRTRRTLAKLNRQKIIPVLNEQLASAEAQQRIGAAHVVLALEPTHPLALEVAVAGLRHETTVIRIGSCKALEFAKEADHDVMAALADRLRHDSEATVREAAAYTMRSLSAQAASVARELGEALEDPFPDVRLWSAFALMELGPAAEPATEFLVRALAERVEDDSNVHPDDETGSYLVYLVRALGEIGKPAKVAIPHLQRAAQNPMVKWKPQFGLLVEWALERCQGKRSKK